MSRLRSIALAIAGRIEEIPELAGKVVVWGRGDLESEFKKRAEQTMGRCVIVRLLDGKNTSKSKTIARMGGSYTVTLFAVPLLTQKDAMDSDALMDAIIDKIHGWWPPSIPSNGIIWCEVDTMDYPDHPSYEVSVLTIKAPQTT